MKNILSITIIAALIITSCKNSNEKSIESQKQDSLMIVLNEREATLNEFIVTYNELERNLDSVTSKQGKILLTANKYDDKNLDQKSRITAEIKAINEIMVLNTNKLNQLSAKLNRSDKKNKDLEKSISNLNNQLNTKYAELNELNERLFALHLEVFFLEETIDTLLSNNQNLRKELSEKADELTAAYYIIGSSKDLQLWNLVDKQGGFLGIGQTSKVSNNLDMNMFTKIDYNKITVIPVNSKRIKIVSTHPTGSFSLDKTGKMVNSILINDPKTFWSVSKYLVISK